MLQGTHEIFAVDNNNELKAVIVEGNNVEMSVNIANATRWGCTINGTGFVAKESASGQHLGPSQNPGSIISPSEVVLEQEATDDPAVFFLKVAGTNKYLCQNPNMPNNLIFAEGGGNATKQKLEAKKIVGTRGIPKRGKF